MPRTVDNSTRDAVVAALRDDQDDRSRAQLARDHGVAPRTVSRWAKEAGVDTEARWATADTRKATQAATDRRRALRSTLADEMLMVDIPALRARLHGDWRKTIVLPSPDGASAERVAEDDALIAKGMRELMTAVGIAVDKTIAIDRHDEQGGDSNSGAVLAELGATLAFYAADMRREHVPEGEQ